ncbi:MAG: nucleotidyltransferase family protein [Gammaproteobacteria bacterium]|nr:nucleotidyltransferase family protein [Gammaproteobacteria bacterium]
MKAMILAAGRGERLLPLTATLPKPLLEVGGETLVERHLRRLVAAGVSDIVLNLSHLGEQIETRLGDGARYGARVVYSHEPGAPLETAGGILAALPLLGDAPFVVVNADIWTDFDFTTLPAAPMLAHLVLVPNPPHHPHGDFGLRGATVTRGADTPYTYAGIGVYCPALFADLAPGRRPLAPLLFAAVAAGALSGGVHDGRWYDIGTAERLAAARRAVGGSA